MSDDGSAQLDIGERLANVQRAAALRQMARPSRRDEPSQASLHDGSFGRAKLTDAALGKVLDAAVSCFMALGYDATSIETVAKRAGYSRRSRYTILEQKRICFVDRFHTLGIARRAQRSGSMKGGHRILK